MDQGIIAALKRRYKGQLLQVMVKNLERYDELRKLGASIAAGVRGLQYAYPANLLDASTMAHEAWKDLTQVTMVNCWLKSNILPQAHVDHLQQFVLAYKHPVRAPVIDELSLLLKKADLEAVCGQSVEVDHSSECDNHFLGDLSALHSLAKNNTDQFKNTVQDWFTVEDNELIKKDEVEMVLRNEIDTSSLGESNAEESAQEPAFDESCMELEPDSSDDSDEIPPTSTRKDVLNSVDLDEALQMAKKLHEVMAQLGEDDSSHLLTTVYRKCLDLRAEKIELNSRQTVICDYRSTITAETVEDMQL